MHTTRIDTYEQLRAEVTETTVAEIAASGWIPRAACDLIDKDVECYFGGKEEHYQADCYQRMPDLGIGKAEGATPVLPRSVNAIDEENNIDGSSKATGYHNGNDIVDLWTIGISSATTWGRGGVGSGAMARCVCP